MNPQRVAPPEPGDASPVSRESTLQPETSDNAVPPSDATQSPGNSVAQPAFRIRPDSPLVMIPLSDGLPRGTSLAESMEQDNNDNNDDNEIDNNNNNNNNNNNSNSWADEDSSSASYTTESQSANGEVPAEPSAGGCMHYKRNCNVIAPCCGEEVACRLCHDESRSDEHKLDRFRITEVICRSCKTRQSAKTNECSNEECRITFGLYHCSICNLWDDDGPRKGTYHCEECGICRVGGRDKYFHCRTCGSCYALSLKNNHKCLANAMRSPCPVCLEDMFTSPRRVIVLKCGHAIHDECRLLIIRGSLRFAVPYCCPLCRDPWGVEEGSAAPKRPAESAAETPRSPVYSMTGLPIPLSEGGSANSDDSESGFETEEEIETRGELLPPTGQNPTVRESGEAEEEILEDDWSSVE